MFIHAEAAELSAKELGAFYTDAQVAEFLVWWAVRDASDTVLDPSFGGGVFLRATCQRLEELGGSPREQVFGVEVDRRVHEEISGKLRLEFQIGARNLRNSDFLEFELATSTPVDAVVGNPPFIRYQRFGGNERERGLSQAAKAGVSLSKLSSSWLPFLIHSVSQLKAGGRLAMVLPAELMYARYAIAGLEFLQRSFGEATFLTFRKKLFPELSEDTLLLLAERKGKACTSWRWRDLQHAGELARFVREGTRAILPCRVLNSAKIAAGDERLIDYVIPRKTRELYRQLVASNRSVQLGDLADVGIGYVTGANDFFHLSPQAALTWKIPEEFLRAAVRRGRSLRGLSFTNVDWQRGLGTGEAAYLLHIKAQDRIPVGLQRYLETGSDIRAAYKVRTRTPWYSVPHVYQPDALLSYMSGVTPRLVTNDARVVAPNSLHVVRYRPSVSLHGRAIAALWQTSLTRLSAELEGHAMGGGMLKLEPTEAQRAILPWPANTRGMLGDAETLDAISRAGDESATMREADTLILRKRLCLTKAECSMLQQAVLILQERRLSKN